MSYEIRKYDGTVLFTLADGIADVSNSSLTFVGKNVSNFGKQQNENFLHLTENFAGLSEPSNKLKGQIWYDTANYVIKVYNSGDWVSQGVLEYTDVEPVATHPGYMWFDTANDQLKINNGNGYTLVGPEQVTGFGTTRLISTSTNSYPVINIEVDGEVVGIISANSFTTSTTGFNNVFRGITLKNYLSTDFQIYGRSVLANLATTSTNIDAGSAGAVPYQSAPGRTSFVNIGSVDTVLYSNGTTPSWKSFAEISSGVSTTATNLKGGLQGSIPYQTGVGITAFVGLEQEGYVLASGATRPKWVPINGVSAGSAFTATNANKLLNGASTTYLYASTSSISATIVERDSGANIFVNNVHGTEFLGVASSAKYADLAEKYMPDTDYVFGTVVAIGGSKEVTACQEGDIAIGVVSTNPAFKMNSELEHGVYIALKGRVPCNVVGAVRKGQRLVASSNGRATAGSGEVFAIALETNAEEGTKVVEVLVL